MCWIDDEREKERLIDHKVFRLRGEWGADDCRAPPYRTDCKEPGPHFQSQYVEGSHSLMYLSWSTALLCLIASKVGRLWAWEQWWGQGSSHTWDALPIYWELLQICVIEAVLPQQENSSFLPPGPADLSRARPSYRGYSLNTGLSIFLEQKAFPGYTHYRSEWMDSNLVLLLYFLLKC